MTRADELLRQREHDYLQDTARLHDAERLLARAWALSDLLVESKGLSRDPPDASAALGAVSSLRLIGETLERMSRLEGKVSLTMKHVDALAVGLLDILRRWVPADQLESVAIEIGRVVDSALGTPRLRLTGPVQP